MAKSLLLLQLSLLLATCFTVFAEDENLVSGVAMPPHHHGGYHSVPPSLAPSSPPHHHHHHHHHSHPPTSAPTPTPTPTPKTPSPAHPPSHHHHHGHPPSKAPVHPPTSHPPAHPPVHPPTSHPPAHPHLPPPTHSPKPSYPFERKLVAVQGVVFLKSCKYAGNDTLSEATPLAGAIVELQCNNSFKPIKAQAKTDKNGYFLLQAPKTVTNYAIHKCKASLVPSKLPMCKQPSDLHGGVSGAILNVDKKKPSITINKVVYALFTVGPFAFEPICPHH